MPQAVTTRHLFARSLLAGLAVFAAQVLFFTALGYYYSWQFWLTGLLTIAIGWVILGAVIHRCAWSLPRVMALGGALPLLIGLGGYYVAEKVLSKPVALVTLGGIALVYWFVTVRLLRRTAAAIAIEPHLYPAVAGLVFIAADIWSMSFLEMLIADYYRMAIPFTIVWVASVILVVVLVAAALRLLGKKLFIVYALLLVALLSKILLVTDTRYIWRDNPNFIDPTLRSQLAAMPPQERPDIIFIVLDTARAANISFCGYPLPTMPKLEHWAQGNATNYIHTIAPSTWTVPSHTSYFSGLYPSEHGVDWHITADNDVTLPPSGHNYFLLPEYLQASGYSTIGICANYAFAFYGHGKNISRGFDYFACPPKSKFGPLCLSYVVTRGLFPHSREWLRLSFDAKDVTDQALARLDHDSEQPLFLFLNYMDAHELVWPPKKYRDMFLSQEPPFMIDIPFKTEEITPDVYAALNGIYDGALRYMDDELARLVEHPRARDALVIIVGDHGQAFGENGQVYHMNRPFEEVSWVPLLVHQPGQTGGAVIDNTTSGLAVYDIMRLAAGLGAVAPAARSSVIASQLHNHPDRNHLTSYAVYRGNWKLLHDFTDANQDRYIRLQPGVLESESLGEPPAATAALLRQDLSTFTPITTLMANDERARLFFHSIGYVN